MEAQKGVVDAHCLQLPKMLSGRMHCRFVLQISIDRSSPLLLCSIRHEQFSSSVECTEGEPYSLGCC